MAGRVWSSEKFWHFSALEMLSISQFQQLQSDYRKDPWLTLESGLSHATCQINLTNRQFLIENSLPTYTYTCFLPQYCVFIVLNPLSAAPSSAHLSMSSNKRRKLDTPTAPSCKFAKYRHERHGIGLLWTLSSNKINLQQQ
jgi:hypothetical protein